MLELIRKAGRRLRKNPTRVGGNGTRTGRLTCRTKHEAEIVKMNIFVSALASSLFAPMIGVETDYLYGLYGSLIDNRTK